MPNTPLFPNDDELVVIKQGNAGSCYLLAGLDCILNNSGREGRELIKKQFVQDLDGGVQVRIRRNKYSNNLKAANINPNNSGTRYRVEKDPKDPNFDVWYIPKTQIDQIEQDTARELAAGRKGVASNSLAVKILERISTFYHTRGGVAEPGATVLAHSERDRFEGSELTFVSALLDIDSESDFIDIDQIIKLKTINPDAPVYIGIEWGEKVGDVYHGRHALRVEKIVPDKGSYIFHLRNPHDNQKVEQFTLAQIKSRSPYVGRFSLSSKDKELTAVILGCHESVGKYIYQHPNLYKALLTIKDKVPGFGNFSQKISLVSFQHEHNRQLFPVIEKLLADPTQLSKLMTCFVLNGHNADQFRNELMKLVVSQPTPDLLMSIPLEISGQTLLTLAQEAKKTNNIAATNYYSSPSFLRVLTHGAINQKVVSSGRNPLDVKREIEQELVNYYLTGAWKHLSNGDLKLFFGQEICSHTSIPQILSQEIFLSKMLSFYTGNDVPISPQLTEHIKKIIVAQPVTQEAFINDFFSKERCSNPKALFDDLQKINLVNPQLGKYLALSAQKKMEEHSPGSFEQFRKDPTAGTNPLFVSSFPTLSDSHINKLAAETVIKITVNKINAEPVEYRVSERRSIAAINERSAALQANLQKLIETPEYVKAKQITDSQDVDKALSDKKKMITNEAKTLTDEWSVIDAYANKIKAVQFVNQSPEAGGIELRNMLQEAPYIKAKKILGLDEDPPVITAAFNDKAKAIDDAINLRRADHQRQVVLEAEKDASRTLEQVKNIAPMDALKTINWFKERYNDPFGDGILSEATKAELFQKINQIQSQLLVEPTKKDIDGGFVKVKGANLVSQRDLIAQKGEEELKKFPVDFGKAISPPQVKTLKAALSNMLGEILNRVRKEVGIIPPSVQTAYDVTLKKIGDTATERERELCMHANNAFKAKVAIMSVDLPFSKLAQELAKFPNLPNSNQLMIATALNQRLKTVQENFLASRDIATFTKDTSTAINATLSAFKNNPAYQGFAAVLEEILTSIELLKPGANAPNLEDIIGNQLGSK